MLIIPLAGKLSRHNLPIITLVNVAVCFAFQSQNSRYYETKIGNIKIAFTT
jgi:hypothetical protein